MTKRNTYLEIQAPERISWTPEEASALTGAPLDAIEKLIKSGELDHVRIGARTLVPARAVREMIEGQA